MGSGKTLSDTVALGVESAAFGLGVNGTKTPQRKGSTVGDDVVVHFLSIAVWSDAGSASAPIQVRWLAPAFNIVPVNTISVGGRTNASRVAGGRVSRVQTIHALVVMKRLGVTAAVIQQRFVKCAPSIRACFHHDGLGQVGVDTSREHKVGEVVRSPQTRCPWLRFGETSLHGAVNVGGIEHGRASFSFGTTGKRTKIDASNVSAKGGGTVLTIFVEIRACVCGLAHGWTGKMRIFRLCPSAAGTTAAKAREGLAIFGRILVVSVRTLVALGLVGTCRCCSATICGRRCDRGQRGGEQGHGDEESGGGGDHCSF
jgi:hypothetical protein